MRKKAKGSSRSAFNEKAVVAAVLNAMSDDPEIMLHRVNTGAAEFGKSFVRFGTPGQSDFSGIIKEIRCPICRTLTGAGVRLEIECKAPKGRLSEPQKAWIKNINAMNGVAIVFQPETIEELFAPNVRTFIRNRIQQPCARCAKESKT